jgi:hypothetical protein
VVLLLIGELLASSQRLLIFSFERTRRDQIGQSSPFLSTGRGAMRYVCGPGDCPEGEDVPEVDEGPEGEIAEILGAGLLAINLSADNVSGNERLKVGCLIRDKAVCQATV